MTYMSVTNFFLAIIKSLQDRSLKIIGNDMV